MNTKYLFKAIADMLMLMPLTLWTGNGRSFMATVLLYAVSNGIEFYDLSFSSDVKSSKFTNLLVWVVMVTIALLAVLSIACVMGYLEANEGVNNSIVISCPEKSVLDFPDINYNLIMYISTLPIIAHISIAINTYAKKRKRFYHKYVN